MFDVESGLQRTRRMLVAAGSTAATKGVQLIVSLLYVPIVIRKIGVEGFGVWTIITTTLTMLLVLDLGVANSLTNFISEAYARSDRDHASRYTTTAFGIMTGISAVLGLAVAVAWPHIGWSRLFNLTSAALSLDVPLAVAIALILFLVDLPARLAVKVLGGYQELAAANLFLMAGGVASLIVMLLVSRQVVSLSTLVAACSGPVVAADVACSAWLLWLHKPWLRPRSAHLDASAARRMLGLGGSLFLLQVAGLLVFDTDNLIIAHYLGPAEVAPYNSAWRLAAIATGLQSLLFPALWPAFSEAWARGDRGWVRRTFWQVLRITMFAALAVAVVMALAGRSIIRVWATDAAVPSEVLMLLMCTWVLISTFMGNTVVVLLAKGAIRLQAWLSLAAGGLNLVLSIWLVQWVGSAGVILGTILSYLLILVVPQTVMAWRALHEVPPPIVE